MKLAPTATKDQDGSERLIGYLECDLKSYREEAPKGHFELGVGRSPFGTF
jgi:hypothetical protein